MNSRFGGRRPASREGKSVGPRSAVRGPLCSRSAWVGGPLCSRSAVGGRRSAVGGRRQQAQPPSKLRRCSRVGTGAGSQLASQVVAALSARVAGVVASSRQAARSSQTAGSPAARVVAGSLAGQPASKQEAGSTVGAGRRVSTGGPAARQQAARQHPASQAGGSEGRRSKVVAGSLAGQPVSKQSCASGVACTPGWPKMVFEFLYDSAAEGRTFCVAIRQDRCLLYTSPSPRDRQKSRMPSSA